MGDMALGGGFSRISPQEIASQNLAAKKGITDNVVTIGTSDAASNADLDGAIKAAKSKGETSIILKITDESKKPIYLKVEITSDGMNNLKSLINAGDNIKLSKAPVFQSFNEASGSLTISDDRTPSVSSTASTAPVATQPLTRESILAAQKNLTKPDYKSMDGDTMMKTDLGKNLAIKMGIDPAKMDNQDKGAMASGFAMVTLKKEFDAKPLKEQTSNAGIRMNPNLTYDQKIAALTSPKMEIISESGNSKGDVITVAKPAMTVEGAEKYLSNGRQAMTNAVNNKAKEFYTKLGGTGEMPSQYLAAIGDGGGTKGVAGVENFCVGNFVYDKTSKAAGDKSTNEVSMTVPTDKPLEVKMYSYGFDGNDTSTINLKIPISGKKPVDVTFSLTPDASGKGIMTVSPADQAILKANGITFDPNTRKITVPNNNVFTGANVEIKVTSATAVAGGSSDERQVHFSSNSPVQFGVEAKGLFDSAKFTAKIENLKGPELAKVKELAKSLPDTVIADAKSGKPVDMSKYFKLEGGGNNPATPKDNPNTNNDEGKLSTEVKGNLRSSYALPDGNGKIDIKSYTDPDLTGVKTLDNKTKTEASDDFHDYVKNDVGTALQKQLIDSNIYTPDSKDENIALSGLRSLSFSKMLIMEKTGLAADAPEFKNMTIDVTMKNKSGQDVTLKVNLADVPPRK